MIDLNDIKTRQKINTVIKRNNENYYYQYRDLTFEDSSIKYLQNMDKYNFSEYKYYCWLSKIKNITPKINTPFHDFTYTPMSEPEFKIKYAYNEIRKSIYNEFESFFYYFSNDERFDKSKIDIIVGGSYVRDKENPKDIDFAICISEELFKLEKEFGREPVFKRESFSDSKLLDFKFFPINFDENNYYIYSKLVMLSNKVKFKESDSEIANNIFKKNKLIRLKKNFLNLNNGISK